MKLRIYWFPNIPCKAFHFPVNTLEEAVAVNNALANYDLFLLEHRHRRDYANAGGLEIWNPDEEEWEDWYDEETGMSFDEYINELERINNSNNEKV